MLITKSQSVIGTWCLASLGLGGALISLVLKRRRVLERNRETSLFAESSIHDQFNVEEWEKDEIKIKSSRSMSFDEDTTLHQKPTVHSAMGGLTNNSENIALVMVRIII
jgi:hypothetical protein